ncbi:12555_t:CDS:10 [Ambispora gerdemannii]|uniref:12555_t:CDS:1 n=1 Tax=Ambispora gerdemannii TaxID=144530 RepID=A0A9N9A5U8_9GLOM|nr:12555_t:CDS:10 [Ambispora gerdemannii]
MNRSGFTTKDSKPSSSLNDFMPSSFHLNTLTSTVSSTASILFNPLATRAVVKGDTVAIISELAPQILDKRRLQTHVNGNSRNSNEGSNQFSSTTTTDRIMRKTRTINMGKILSESELPESTAPLSLFQGFKVTYPEYSTSSIKEGSTKKKSKHLQKRKTRGHFSEDGCASVDGFSDTASIDNEFKPLNQLIVDRDRVIREKDKLNTREARESAELSRIESHINELERQRRELEINLIKFQNRKEDLAEKLEDLNERIVNYGQEENHRIAEKRGRGSKRTLTVKQYDPGTCIKTLEGHCSVISCLDLDKPDGKLVTASVDDTLRVWDLTTGKYMGILDGHEGIVNCLQVNGNHLFTGSSDRTIRQWNLDKISHKTSSTAISHLSSPLLRGNGLEHYDNHEEISHEEISHGEISHEEIMHEENNDHENIGENAWMATLDGHSGEITCLYCEDQYLLSGSADRTMKQWDIETSQCILTLDILWAISSTKVTSVLGENFVLDEGDFVGALQFWNYALASGTRDGAIRMWDLRTGQVHRTLLGHAGPITSLQFNEIQVVSGSLDRSIMIWDLRTGTVFDTLTYAHAVTDLQFDANKIVCAAGDSDVLIYNRNSLQYTHYKGHTKPVECIRYKNNLLVSGGRDSVVKLWSL